MPKKQPKNAYYFFMLDFREEQKKNGITYNNLTEVQVAADPVWRQGMPGMRAKYESMAKAEKDRLRGAPNKKFTSNGVSFAEIEAEQRTLMEIQEQELTEIISFVRQKKVHNMLLEADIFLIDVNAYCYAGSHYFIAESTVLCFNLFEGIKEIYHTSINPGRIPIGYASDVKLGASELGLGMPEEDKRTDFPMVLAYLIDFLKQNSRGAADPPIYTMPEKVEQVQDFIRQICNCSGEDDSRFRVYKLENLFFHMVNAIKESAEDGYPKSSLATAYLKKDQFKYTPGLGCEHHEASDKAVECSRSRVQRWAYSILDKCCPVAGIEPVPGRHVPHGLDVEGVLSYNEHRKEVLGSRAASAIGTSSNGSVMNETYASSSVAWDVNKSQRSHTPMRLPKTNFSKSLRVPPNLTERDFPTLKGAGRGGIRIADDMQNMSLKK